MKSQSIYKLNLTLGLLKFWQTLAGKSCSVLWYIKGKLRGFSNICWKIWKDGTLFNCTQKSIKNSTHTTPLHYCEAHSCPRSELWTIKLLVFKTTKVPKPHINQTNNTVHRGRPKNLTPRWTTVMCDGWWCTMAALIMIYQSMGFQDGQSTQIPYQTNNFAVCDNGALYGKNELSKVLFHMAKI